jgi:hypothetical protein
MINKPHNLTSWANKLIGLPLFHIRYFPPHTWGFYFGKKSLVGFFVALDNQKPRYHFESDIKIKPSTSSPHRLNQVLAKTTVQAIALSESKGFALVMTLKKDQPEFQLIIQMAPYLPRIYLIQEDRYLFDSIHGWDPKTTIRIKNSVWVEAPNLIHEQVTLMSLRYQYETLLQDYLKKKQHRHQQLLRDQVKHQLHLHYQELADAVKLQPNLPWSSYQNPKNLPLPIKIMTSDYRGMQWLYQQYKKAKSGLRHLDQEIRDNQDLIKQIQELVTLVKTGHALALQTIQTTLQQWRLISGVQPKPVLVRHDAPYWLMYQKRKFSFGKNAKQNQNLTFSIAKKSDIFMHIQDAPGAHVIVHHANFDHDILIQGAQLVLALAGKIAGRVTYAKVGSLKATTVLGQVMVKDSRTIQVHAQDEIWKPLLLQAQRY